MSLKTRNELDRGTNLDHNLEKEGEYNHGDGLGSEAGRIEEQLGYGSISGKPEKTSSWRVIKKKADSRLFNAGFNHLFQADFKIIIIFFDFHGGQVFFISSIFFSLKKQTVTDIGS